MVGATERRHAGAVPKLIASQITKRFGGVTVLDGIDLVVRGGEVVALTGENGAGKSTLMQICAGLLRADAGTVTVGGDIGYCPQVPGLFELLTADDHLVMFGRGAGMSPRRVAAAGPRDPRRVRLPGAGAQRDP